jgi:ABC-type branched-subunit amino acid transport system substrate-binding protein
MLKRLPIFIFLLILFYVYLKEKSFNESTIKIGTSLPNTGIIKQWGQSVEAGANSYFNYTNENNIIKGKKIDFIIYDDKYEPELTLDNLKKLIYIDKVYALFGFVGTPTVKNILPILDEENIPLIAPFTGASFLRTKNHPNYINFRSSYSQEIEALIQHLINIKELNKFAVFYQNDDYGEEGYVSLINSLKKRDLKLIAEGSYKRNTISIGHAIHEIKYASPEVIIMIGAYKTNALFIKKAKQDSNLKDTIFCNISFGDANAMIAELKMLGVDTTNLIFSQVVPSYMDTSIPVIQEYQTLMSKYYPKEEFGFISLEAFLASKVFVWALSQIKGDITRSELVRLLKKPPPNLLDGLEINFKNSQLLNKIYLFEYNQSKFQQIKQ